MICAAIALAGCGSAAGPETVPSGPILTPASGHTTEAESAHESEHRESGRATPEELREDRAASEHAERVERENEAPGHRYPAAAQQAFLTGCKAEEASASSCGCFLHKIEARDSLAEFEALSAAMAAGQSPPARLKEEGEICGVGGG
jgi:hypothetical protein